MLTDTIMEDLATHKKTMFVLGGAEYRDIFSPVISSYESQFCFAVHYEGMPFGDCGDSGQTWLN